MIMFNSLSDFLVNDFSVEKIFLLFVFFIPAYLFLYVFIVINENWPVKRRILFVYFLIIQISDSEKNFFYFNLWLWPYNNFYDVAIQQRELYFGYFHDQKNWVLIWFWEKRKYSHIMFLFWRS